MRNCPNLSGGFARKVPETVHSLFCGSLVQALGIPEELFHHFEIDLDPAQRLARSRVQFPGDSFPLALDGAADIARRPPVFCSQNGGKALVSPRDFCR
jgi:hypothetical protein